MTRIAHLSDLHFGAEDRQVCAALADTLHDLQPDLVAVSGDLTQRARPVQFRAAAAFLDGLPGRKLIVPGNHDVPLFNLAARLLWPYRAYEKAFGSRTRFAPFTTAELMLFAADSTRPWRHKEGWLGQRGQRALRDHASGPHTPCVGMIMHHPLVWSGGDASRVDGGQQAARLYEAGVDFILCGHHHSSSVRALTLPRRAGNEPAGHIIQIAAGTSTSVRRRQHPNTFNLIEFTAATRARAALQISHWTHDAGSSRFESAGQQSWTLPRRAAP